MVCPCREAKWPRRSAQAEAAAKKLFDAGATGVVVKAQIHAGGRGKGGGVKLAKSVAEASELASKILGMNLVTHQTGPEGRIVRRLLIEETLPIEKELYLGIVIDRAEARPVFMASAAGGMEIEEVAAENPDAIRKEYIDPGMGLEAISGAQTSFCAGTEAGTDQFRSAIHDRPIYGVSLKPMVRWWRSILSSVAPTAGCLRWMRR